MGGTAEDRAGSGSSTGCWGRLERRSSAAAIEPIWSQMRIRGNEAGAAEESIMS